LSLFLAMRVPRFPATGDEIGECSRFANQGLRRETKRGPLQSRTTRGEDVREGSIPDLFLKPLLPVLAVRIYVLLCDNRQRIYYFYFRWSLIVEDLVKQDID
jgi:hypothetical protein